MKNETPHQLQNYICHDSGEYIIRHNARPARYFLYETHRRWFEYIENPEKCKTESEVYKTGHIKTEAKRHHAQQHSRKLIYDYFRSILFFKDVSFCIPRDYPSDDYKNYRQQRIQSGP